MEKTSRYLLNCDNNPEKIIKEHYSIISGNSNVMISAPHTYSHVRSGKRKPKDAGTLTIVKLLKELSQVHVIYINKEVKFDPNYNLNNIYQRELIQYIKENNIEYLIDIHGSKAVRTFDIEIGTNYYKNVNGDKELVNNVIGILHKNKIKKTRIDKRFKSSKDTVSKVINTETGIQTLQFEISSQYRKLRNNMQKHARLINSLLDTIRYLERRNKMLDINYEEKYDDILEIKPSYGYKRELGIIEYNQIGLEIEVSVNFDRNSYSFIRKMLLKVKELIADNGYFVKDGTILGDYSFEIVLDPMKIEDINRIYTSLLEIIAFSNGAIEISKEKKCGIHLNFNKFDVTDLNIAHKRVTTFVSENRKFFDENMYKQFKFIWDYEEYLNYQNEVGDKYLWINYLKSKLVEVRNIKANISPKDLVTVLSSVLECLYYDKEVEAIDHSTYLRLDKIYDTAFDKNKNENVFKNLKDNDFIVISLRDSNANIVNIPDEIIEQIKRLI